MFTGIIEETGEVLWLRKSTRGTTELRLTASKEMVKSLHDGDSLAVNGCCLTVTSSKKEHIKFDVLTETLRCTNLGELRSGDAVNLERSLSAGGRLGGHFVQGHVDSTAEVVSQEKQGADTRLEISMSPEIARFIAYKGSVAINGVSLTVAEVLKSSFVIWLIPHTRAVTNLGSLDDGSMINLEVDILAKYLDRMREVRENGPAPE